MIAPYGKAVVVGQRQGGRGIRPVGAAVLLRRLGPVAAAFRNAVAGRGFLFLPVFFAVGIGLYFSGALASFIGTRESWMPWGLGGAGASLSIMAMLLRARMGAGSAALVLLGMTFLGFAAADNRARNLATPMLTVPVGPVMIEGRVADLEPFPGRPRITLREVRPVEGPRWRPSPDLPETVRFRLRAAGSEFRPGDRIRIRVRLLPPPAPAMPGAFDFQRFAYFKGIGAIGFAVGRAETVERSRAPGWRERLTRFRLSMAERITAALPGPEGAVAAALITGHRALIPEADLETFRRSGLAHLLAISGLHIGLIAGLVFISVRLLLMAAAPWSVKLCAKEIAALCALAAALVYTGLAGATVPTQRAFLMAGLVLVAILVRRRGLTLRSVAIAGLLILSLTPESLFSASFQMSFAAVLALVALFEALRGRDWQGAGRPERGAGRAIGVYLTGLVLASLAANVATGPFVLHHFNQTAHYGLIANLIGVPLTAFWIMPWALAGLALMPFGLEAVALSPMGWGIGALLFTTNTISALPGAVGYLASAPPWALPAAVLGGLWLCLAAGPVRWAGLLGVALWGAGLAAARPPDIIVDGGARQAAVRLDDGRFVLLHGRRASFAAESWLERAGAGGRNRGAAAVRDGERRAGLACDGQGCSLMQRGLSVAIAESGPAAAEDCWRADVLISLVSRPRSCPKGRAAESVSIDRFDLWRKGSHAVWLGGGGRQGVRVETVAESRPVMPWTLPLVRRGAPTVYRPFSEDQAAHRP